MKKCRMIFNHFFQLTLGFFIIYVAASCATGVVSYQIDDYQKFTRCSYEVSNCSKTSEFVDVNISGSFPQISSYQKIKDLWGDKSQPYSLYWDPEHPNYPIYNIEMPEIKGSLLIQTGYYDKDIDTDDFLTIELLAEIENFYIAYDALLKVKPEWLTADYTQVKHPNSQDPYHIIVKMPSLNPKIPEYGRFEIWKKKEVPRKDDKVSIPGNINKCKGGVLSIGV
jgi:hypothetical protein